MGVRPHRASASRVIDPLQCLYPLRGDVEWLPDVDTEPMATGKALHWMSEQCVLRQGGTIVQAVQQFPLASAHRLAGMWPHLQAWLEASDTEWRAEVPLFWDRATGKSVERARTSPKRDTEVQAVVDLLAWDEHAAELWDIKTGRPQWALVDQLATSAVAVRGLTGVSMVTASFLFVDAKGTHDEMHIYDAALMDAHEAKLEAAMLAMPDAMPLPGALCRFCKVAECAEGDILRTRMGWNRK